MGRKQITVVTVLLLSVLLAGVGQAWALSITPSTPMAGQPITISSGAVIPEVITVYAGPGCSGTIIYSGTVPAGGKLYVPGQPVGEYSTNTNFEHGCLNFTVLPSPP